MFLALSYSCPPQLNMATLISLIFFLDTISNLLSRCSIQVNKCNKLPCDVCFRIHESTLNRHLLFNTDVGDLISHNVERLWTFNFVDDFIQNVITNTFSQFILYCFAPVRCISGTIFEVFFKHFVTTPYSVIKKSLKVPGVIMLELNISCIITMATKCKTLLSTKNNII